MGRKCCLVMGVFVLVFLLNAPAIGLHIHFRLKMIPNFERREVDFFFFPPNMGGGEGERFLVGWMKNKFEMGN
jgi:hypothetical protein